MCISPSYLDGVGAVSCRNCWQCRKDRVNDLIGRSIAEQKHSTTTLAATLTYAGDVVNAATLVYADIQNFLKRLRASGYKVRYICAGEYGSLKGRAHWHIILFFRGKAPDVPIDQRTEWKFWKHGFSYFQKPDYGGFAYLLKYALKQTDDKGAVSHLAMSKKPPLGFDHFMGLARSHIRDGLSPTDPYYSFGDHFDANGKRRKFRLQGRMREIYLDAFLEGWAEYHSCPPPHTEFLLEYEDEILRKTEQWTDEQWIKHLNSKTLPPPEPLTEYVLGEPVEVLSHFIAGGDLYTIFNNGKTEVRTEEQCLLIENERLGSALQSVGVPLRTRLAALNMLHRQSSKSSAAIDPKPPNVAPPSSLQARLSSDHKEKPHRPQKRKPKRLPNGKPS